MTEKVKRSILLIDDNTSLLTALGDFLAFEGYDVTAAASGEEGLEKLESMTPDIIILDISMPGIGGIGFLKRISDAEGKPSCPVLVLTARANMAEFFEDVNVDGFIAKPCNPNKLLMEVRRIIFLRHGEAVTKKTTSSITLLIGENDEDIAKRLSVAFDKKGYSVEVVQTGPEVVERAVTLKPDIVAVKMVLQNMNGKAVAEMLKMMPNTKDIPIVLYDNNSGATLPVISEKRVGGGIRAVVKSDKADDIIAAAEEISG